MKQKPLAPHVARAIGAVQMMPAPGAHRQAAPHVAAAVLRGSSAAPQLRDRGAGALQLAKAPAPKPKKPLAVPATATTTAGASGASPAAAVFASSQSMVSSSTAAVTSGSQGAVGVGVSGAVSSTPSPSHDSGSAAAAAGSSSGSALDASFGAGPAAAAGSNSAVVVAAASGGASTGSSPAAATVPAAMPATVAEADAANLPRLTENTNENWAFRKWLMGRTLTVMTVVEPAPNKDYCRVYLLERYQQNTISYHVHLPVVRFGSIWSGKCVLTGKEDCPRWADLVEIWSKIPKEKWKKYIKERKTGWDVKGSKPFGRGHFKK